MNGIVSVQKALNYIDSNLLTVSGAHEIADVICISESQLNKDFSITGYSVGEYIRNRRLYEAACDLQAKNVKIIEVAYKYGYETPEGFTRAFSKFHGVSPSEVVNDEKKIKSFCALNLGNFLMGEITNEYEIKRIFPIKLIGIVETFVGRPGSEEIYNLWEKFYKKTGRKIFEGGIPENDIERAIVENSIGEYGVLVESEDNYTRYYIAGKYTGGKIPKGMELLEYAADEWLISRRYIKANDAGKGHDFSKERFIKSKNKNYVLKDAYEIQWFGNKLELEYHLENKCYEEWVPLECNEGRINGKIQKVVSYIGMIICGVILGALLMNIKVKRQQDEIQNTKDQFVSDMLLLYERFKEEPNYDIPASKGDADYFTLMKRSRLLGSYMRDFIYTIEDYINNGGTN